LFVQQLSEEYNEIIQLYQKPGSKENAYAKISYYGWLIDRGRHGLGNTINQYIGDWKVFEERWNKAFELYDWRTQPHELLKYLEDGIKDLNGIDQSLLTNWKYWNLTKFIIGYERYNFPGGEAEMYTFGLPLAYKAFGIPYGVTYAEPTPIGAIGGEWSVAIPKYTINNINQILPISKILIGYGNLISLNSSLDGLEKDDHEEVYQLLRWKLIYLWEKKLKEK
jgi:hypothetical protein